LTSLGFSEFFIILFIALILLVWWKGITRIWKEKEYESKEEE